MTDERDSLCELLALRSTEGLSHAESRQATRLMTSHPDLDAEQFERAAAVLHLAMLGPEAPMPRALAGRLIVAGERFVGTELGPGRPARSLRSRASRLMASGWWAAAAVLAIAVIGWWPEMRQSRRNTPQSTTTSSPTLDSLLAEPGTVLLTWSATEDAAATHASGEVVWNNNRQAGFMRFSGLEANDPDDHQYQLWIFDRTRDERYPVDGGVFDIAADATEVIVPIDPRVPVGEPYLFAITVEPPGGVVVSTRQRIALLAQPS
jgi:anti-sigma-K factor RskA